MNLRNVFKNYYWKCRLGLNRRVFNIAVVHHKTINFQKIKLIKFQKVSGWRGFAVRGLYMQLNSNHKVSLTARKNVTIIIT